MMPELTYYQKNREKIRAQQKARHQQRKLEDPEYMEKRRSLIKSIMLKGVVKKLEMLIIKNIMRMEERKIEERIDYRKLKIT